MGKALELISGGATAPGATITAVTMNSTDSSTVRNFVSPAKAYLLNAWTYNHAVGVARIRSPKLHDNVQGLRFRAPATLPVPLLDFGAKQLLTAQDNLTIEISGGTTASTVENIAVEIYYEDLPGIASMLRTTDEVTSKFVERAIVEVAITGTTVAGYQGSAAVNATFDLLKANTWYALMGIETDAAVCAVTVKGPDTGNLRVGVPGYAAQKDEGRDWFYRQAYFYKLPLIPSFNSANKAGTFVEIVSNETAASPNVSLLLAELSG